MILKCSTLLVSLCIVCYSALASAEGDRPFDLMVGDVAPELSVGEWIKGEPITGYEHGKIYIIDFWATWCGPCIAGFPHLSELQEHYEDEGVIVIGFASAAAPDKIDKARKLILGKKNDVTRYRVAFDDEDSSTWARMMKAAGKNGLPTAFIVDRSGRIAFMGNPNGMDATLKAVIAGETDGTREAAKYLVQLEAENLVRTFNTMMQRAAYDEAYEAGWSFVNGPGADNVNLLSTVAWAIVNPDGRTARRDLDLALAAATKACALTNWEDAGQLDTLAWCHYHSGDLDKAIEIETNALDLVAENDLVTRRHIETTLKRFEARE